jgi:hypothetical protein
LAASFIGHNPKDVPALTAGLCWFAALAAPGWWDKHEWTREDTALQLAYTVLHVADWGQTLDIENHPGHFDHNPILGKHPSRGTVNTYFATTLALHWVAARAMPPKWRKRFQAGTMALQFVVIKDNYEAGIRIDF